MAFHRDWEPLRHDMWGPGILHFVFWVIVLIALVALAVWLITSTRKMSAPPPATPLPPQRPAVDPALEEARMRYARGQLSREDYVRIVTDLGGQAPPG